MRVIVIADDDSLVGHMENEAADVLISAGDIWDSTSEKAQAKYGCRTVFAVKGNHDSAAPFASGITDLHFNIALHDGIRFGGFSGSWKYKPRGHHMFEQFEVARALRSFPAVDVFVAHNSPTGFHERDSEVHQGFEAFTDYIDRVQPAYFIHGHQHVNQVSQRDGTSIIGVFGEAAINLKIGR
jgi:Icc-related predicted phosphoesterase